MLDRMRRPLLVACSIIALAAAACGSTDPGLTARRSNASGGDASTPADTPPDASTISTDTVPDSTPPATDPSTPGGSGISIPGVDNTVPAASVVPADPNDVQIDFGDKKTPRPYDEYLQAALDDIQDYWRVTYPEVYGSPYIELSGGIYASYPRRSDNKIPHGCAGDPAETYPAQGNAFYCGTGDYIAYDDFGLIPDEVREFGNVAVGVLLAHEYGHAIQGRVGVLPPKPVVYKEQQADCFAGAWTAHVARGESSRLTLTDQDVKQGLSAMVSLKDGELNEDVFTGQAHGSAFDRVGAFQNGFSGGAAACKKMETDPLPLLNLQFTTTDEEASNGNLPYNDSAAGAGIVTASVNDLSRYWTATFTANKLTYKVPTFTTFDHGGPFPTCDGFSDKDFPFHAIYCAASNTVFFDQQYAETVYTKFGDFAVSYIISNAVSDGVQAQLGSTLNGDSRSLIDECLTGTWTHDVIPPTDPALRTTDHFYISPGDLDEAVETALVTGAGGDSMGSSFAKIDNFRAGVLGGLDECNKRISAG